MLHIAICDHSIQSSSKLETLLGHIATIYSEEFLVDVFYSKKTFQESFIKKFYDIVYMEIELEDIETKDNLISNSYELKYDKYDNDNNNDDINKYNDNNNMEHGIALGYWIRDRLDNNLVEIIYMSSNEKYAMQLFKTRPMDFLIKPITFTQILEHIQIVKRIMKHQVDQFEFNVGYNSYKIPYDEIMLFENSSRKINIVTTNSTYSFYGSIEKIKEKCVASNFINIHKSYFVNMDYIIKYEYHQVTMKNGAILPISQPNRKRIRSQRLYSENIS